MKIKTNINVVEINKKYSRFKIDGLRRVSSIIKIKKANIE